MNAKTKKWLIIGFGAAALIGGGIYLYRRYKKNRLVPEAPETPNVNVPTEGSVTPPSAGKTQGAPAKTQPANKPLTAAANANIYNVTYVGNQTRVGRLSRIIKKSNENIGYFIRLASIEGKDYVVFGDKANGNKPSLILKSQTNY